MRLIWVLGLTVLLSCSGEGQPKVVANMGDLHDDGVAADAAHDTPPEVVDAVVTLEPAEVEIVDGLGTLTVSLSHSPDQGPVTVGLAAGDGFSISPTELVFEASGTLRQSATVSVVGHPPCAARTDVAIDAVVTHDGIYGGVAVEPVIAFTTDHGGPPSFDVSPLNATVNEEEETSADVIVTLSDGCLLDGEQIELPVAASDDQISVSPELLTFDAVGQSQVVVVSPVDDCEFEPLTTSMVTFGPLAEPFEDEEFPSVEVVTIDTGDDDSVIITPTLLTTSEDGTTATFTVAFPFCLLEDVSATVSATIGDPSEGTVGPASIVLTTLNQSGTFTVTGLDDLTCDGDQTHQVRFDVASDDPDYDGLSLNSVGVTNQDNDLAVIAVPTALAIIEGQSAEFDLVASCGARAVAINNLSPAQMTVSAANATVTPMPQTFTVSAIDDALQNGNRTVYVDIVGAQPLMIPVTIIDDD